MADLGMVVDVVDVYNRPIAVASRADVLQRKLGFRTVHIFLFDSFGRLLLQKLPTEHARSPGRLGSSVAGYLHSGESYSTAAHRKLREELSIDVPISYIGTWQMIDVSSRKFVGLYSGTALRKPKFDPKEIAAIEYMSPDKLDAELRRRPRRFTPTFAFVYE